VKRRRLLVVKRTEALHRIRARPAQLDVIANDVFDADSFADGGDIAIGDTAGHRLSLEPPPDDDARSAARIDPPGLAGTDHAAREPLLGVGAVLSAVQQQRCLGAGQ
jgi:hypothetical protein